MGATLLLVAWLEASRVSVGLWDDCVKYVYGSSGSGVLSHKLSLESWKKFAVYKIKPFQHRHRMTTCSYNIRLCYIKLLPLLCETYVLS